jgi:hypothetical protein
MSVDVMAARNGHSHILNLNLDWKSQEKNGSLVYSCLVCQDPRERLAFNCKSHEQSEAHKINLKSFQLPVSSSTLNVLGATQNPHSSNVDDVIKEDAIRALILSISARPGHPTTHPGGLPLPSSSGSASAAAATFESTSTQSDSPFTGIDWNMFEALEDTTLQYDPLQNAAERIAQASLDFLNGDLSADDEDMAPDLSEEEGSSRYLLLSLFILSTHQIFSQ